MGYDYALVHLKYTIPPAVALTSLCRPLCTRVDVYKILFLIGMAVGATTPWDAYLIRRRVWSYPPSAIMGPRLFAIPIEEAFFFVIQTYNTSLVYLLLSKPIFKPAYLVGAARRGRLARLRRNRTWGQIVTASVTVTGALLIRKGGAGTYLGLILAWTGPFALFLWTVAYQFLGNLPVWNVALPIALPTLYLWIVDTLALKRGTWSIGSGTKLEIYVWPHLELEEAIFFLATNMLITFGLVAFDNAMAILEAFPALFPVLPPLPSPLMLLQALFTSPEDFDDMRIAGIQEGVARLKTKSRSFYLASAAFSGRLRIDLILLYSFCRVADDMVDNAGCEASSRMWISKLQEFLNDAYSGDSSHGAKVKPAIIPTGSKMSNSQEIKARVATSPMSRKINEFPPSTRSALVFLPTPLLSSKPLYDLLCGFRTDLEFQGPDICLAGTGRELPITNESDLEIYASRVAGTIAELCLELVFHHSPNGSDISCQDRKFLISAGGRMGIALQYVNIARDVATDAAIGRVYIPTTWLSEEGLVPHDVISHPRGEKVERLRKRLLKKAFVIYEEAKGAMERLPLEARAPLRVAVESYMEIGRVLGEKGYRFKAGRATVPKMRRIRVAWKALTKG